jgi:hypothetical protein
MEMTANLEFASDGSAPIEARGIGLEDNPITFTTDGRGIYVAAPREGAATPVMHVDWASGKKQLWKELRACLARRERPALCPSTDGGRVLKPKNPILGTDMAGIVDSVGKRVTRFRPGDEVFG